MSSARFQTLHGLLLHAQPMKESSYLCTLFTAQNGLIRCQLEQSTPETFREVEIKVSRRGRFLRSSGFRYLRPLIINHNSARLQAMYVNELLFKLMPSEIADERFYGVYLSTLHYLQQQISVVQALRYFERQLLVALGQGVDYRMLSNGQAIVATQRYRFQALQGFLPDDAGRYHGAQILAVAEQHYSVPGALTVARECQQLQIEAILGGKSLNSKQWFNIGSQPAGSAS